MKREILGIILLFGSLGVLSLFVGLTESEGFEAVLYTIFGLILIIIDVFFLRFLQKKKKQLAREKKLKILYEYLKKNDNKTNVLEFAQYSGLNPDEAREIIEHLAIKVGVSPIIDDSGKIYYQF